MAYLIADSGSTKTDWCLVRKGKKPMRFSTQGINPYLQSRDMITNLLKKELPWNNEKYEAKHLHYYGAGAANPAKQNFLKEILTEHFGIKKTDVQGDIMAACRALCGNKPGIVSILGTGSTSCYYDGKKIREQKPSLGYIAGDEGGGNYMGKRILQYYAYGTFDAELRLDFEMRFGDNIREIINTLYHQPNPNRYLASFVVMLKENRGHYMVENIIEDCLNDFFHTSILKHRNTWNMPLYFSGSVAYEFKDVLGNLCHQYELEIGDVIKSPMEGMIKYYKKVIG
ncbi:MAG: N-acetylglucosamine kinase [Flavipsychrobacter sp.]|jgi:N-acetylglucosamine kinase-like BadF-type ATPase|nr:N-acetylglucosamine kinase [Flavipsychrobacter sp.]